MVSIVVGVPVRLPIQMHSAPGIGLAHGGSGVGRGGVGCGHWHDCPVRELIPQKIVSMTTVGGAVATGVQVGVGARLVLIAIAASIRAGGNVAALGLADELAKGAEDGEVGGAEVVTSCSPSTPQIATVISVQNANTGHTSRRAGVTAG